MANKSLKLAMQRESGYKQLKRYLSLECGMSEKIRVKISDANRIWIQTIKAIFVFGMWDEWKNARRRKSKKLLSCELGFL